MLAGTIARIHSQNLPNAGILPLTFVEADDYTRVEQGGVLIVCEIRATVQRGHELDVEISGKGTIRAHHSLTTRQVEIMLAGGLINRVRAKKRERPGGKAAA